MLCQQNCVWCGCEQQLWLEDSADNIARIGSWDAWCDGGSETLACVMATVQNQAASLACHRPSLLIDGGSGPLWALASLGRCWAALLGRWEAAWWLRTRVAQCAADAAFDVHARVRCACAQCFLVSAHARGCRCRPCSAGANGVAARGETVTRDGYWTDGRDVYETS